MCMYSKYARLIIHISPNTREGLIIVNHVRRGCLYVNQNEMSVFCSTRLQTLALQWSQKECKNIHVLIFISTFALFLFSFLKLAGIKSIFKVQSVYSLTCLCGLCAANPLCISYTQVHFVKLAGKNLTKKQWFGGLLPLERVGGGEG